MKRRLLIMFLLGCLLPFAVQAQHGTFRFAQITDIHFSPNNPNPTEDLLRSVAQINAIDSIDFVLVTGDITEEGDRATMLKVKETLDLLKAKYYVILGNHETKWSDSGCTAFGEIFGGERFEFEHKGILFLGFNSGPLMRMAYGHVVPQDIRWMTEEMDKFGKDKPVILVTHYPLLDGDVDNWYEVTDAVRPYNIRLFIGGHYHRNRDLRYDGIPGILMRSNLRDKDGKPGYGIYDITKDSILVYTQRIGEPKKQWAAFSLTQPYYDRNGKAEKYPDFSVNTEYPNVKEQWVVQTGAGIYCSPAIEKDKVFVGDDMGYLTCYALKNGKKLWNFQSGKRIVGTPAAADGIASVHQQKAAGTIGVFGFAFGKTALAKQCGLLVARNTGHRHLYAAQVGVTVNLAGIRHTRQHGAGDIQRVQQCIIPVQLVDIIQHGAAGVGSVRYMHLAAGQLPHQPAVHRAKQNFSRLCALPCARHMVQNPLDFGCGKVGIRHKAGILFDILCHARLAEQLIHQRCSAAALPHNGVINGAAGRFFPQNRGFALVGNADGGNIMRIHAALGYHLVHHAILAGPYLHGVVLHPALLGV